MFQSNPELIRIRTSYQIIGPHLDIQAARHAASQLDGQLGPNILEHFDKPPNLPGYLLLHPPTAAAFQTRPGALFHQHPTLGVADIPSAWVPAYLHWSDRLSRSQEVIRARMHMVRAMHLGDDYQELITADPIVAALMLYSFTPEPDSRVRAQLLETALQNELGAYVCAESLHTLTERTAIATALSRDSLALLGASSIPLFTGHCLQQACSHHDLPAGLILAQHGTDEELAGWLRRTGFAACEDSAAASAMLTLNPNAAAGVRALWLATLQRPQAIDDAYATARWSRCTWRSEAWEELKDSLKPWATGDGAQGFWNWFVHVEPEIAAAELESPIDPLWCYELLHALDLPDDRLRFRLADQLGRMTYDLESSLVLEALNRRNQIRQKGYSR